MAQHWAKDFYNSKEWDKARRAHIAKVKGLCERCGRVGKIVHHKTYLTEDNIDDPWTTLGADNLELLCHECHNDEHLAADFTADGLRFNEFGELVQK